MKLLLLCVLATSAVIVVMSSNYCSTSAINQFNSVYSQLKNLERYNHIKQCRRDAALKEVVTSIGQYGRNLQQKIIKLFNLYNKKNWKRYNGHCYLLAPQSVKWTEAEKRCEDMGGFLVNIETVAEHKWLMKQIRKLSNTYYWIGLTLKPNLYHWKHTNRKLSLKLFAKGHPKKSNHHCVSMYNNYWYTRYCHSCIYFICESSSC